MNVTRGEMEPFSVSAENVGGIDTASAEFPPGVSVLVGRNATNRTSFLRAVMASFGSDRFSLKTDADEGSVALQYDGRTFARSFARRNGTVDDAGSPYLDDAETADLFAFLLEDNPARRAVRRTEDLRTVIMEPVDTDEIEAEIDRLRRRREEIRSRLDELDELAAELPDQEAERASLAAELEETRAEIARIEERLRERDDETDEELEARLDERDRLRGRLDDLERRVETLRDSRDALHDQRESLEERLDDLDDVSLDRRDELESRIDDFRRRERSLQSDVNQLGQLLQFNEETLADDHTPLGGDGSSSVGKLDPASEEVTCWTCGTTVRRDRIGETLERLRALRERKSDERQDVRAELRELMSDLERIEEIRSERHRLEHHLETVNQELSETGSTLDELSVRREETEDELESVDSAVVALEGQKANGGDGEREELSRLRVERRRLEHRLEDVTERIETTEHQLEERDELQDRRETIEADLLEKRTHIDRLETRAVESFNEHMDAILGVLEYENVERIWIERKGDGASGSPGGGSTFELHVVRDTVEGAVYDDTVSHLSESEREVVGLVFALAGYLTHEVYEDIPVLVLDSLEAIDADRIAAVLDYFDAFATFLLVALLPEDAAATSDSYNYVREI